jgi:O-antigen ligase
MFREAPVCGFGFGCFEHAFPAFQSTSIQFGRWTDAHNDYVQLLAEGGIVAGALAAAAALLFARGVALRLRQAPARVRSLLLGIGIGLVAVAAHSTVDFGLHKPANAFLLAAICGTTTAALHLPPGQETGASGRHAR